ncbi:MAG TPA: aminoglycoside phosphotransferase family protein [Stellaceae bacterium]|nr:aminoglycoside phosphotransferase family protein [Stellaceae bacterium]
MTVSDSLLDLLRALPATADLKPGEVVAMTAKGVNHDHYRLARHRMVLRVPRSVPWIPDAAAQLAGEAAAFLRAEPAGVTPRLIAALPAAPALPRGALLVEEIAGRPPRLPVDLPALAQALARIHALPLPAPEQRAPLPDHENAGPVAATLAFIRQQCKFLARIDIAAATRAALADELAWAERYTAGTPAASQPLALVGTDTHPGNFIIRADGSAVLVDLERVCYGSPAIDLAHASLYTSTTWDVEVQAELSRTDVEGFYRRYRAATGDAQAAALRPWLLPARRLTWLRTMMWAARWRALSERDALAVEPALRQHIDGRLVDFFRPEIVARVRAEWLGGEPLGL